MAWTSCLPSDLVTVDSSKQHPFPFREAATDKLTPEPIRVTKCAPWTAEDEYKRSGNSCKSFIYQFGSSSAQRAAIHSFDLDYYDSH